VPLSAPLPLNQYIPTATIQRNDTQVKCCDLRLRAHVAAVPGHQAATVHR